MLKLFTILGFTIAALAGCATQYPGPSTDKNSLVKLSTGGLQNHSAYPSDKLVVRIYQGSDAKGKELGMILLSPDQVASELKLDQGMKYTLSLTSIESNFGGYTSCGFLISLMPGVDENYQLDYTTSKKSCDIVMAKVDMQGKTSNVQRVSAPASGGVQFSAQVIRY